MNAVKSKSTKQKYQQGKYWLLTIPKSEFTPYLPKQIDWIKGQLEIGKGGFEHWQVVACFNKKVRLGGIKEVFGAKAHCELSRSESANDYVHKEETSVAGTRFELGKRPMKMNSKVDWAEILEHAKNGRFDLIPAQILVTHYRALSQIRLDYKKPTNGQRETVVYVGPTGTGKSHRAWEEAGMTAYPKQPTTKWWDGYRPDYHKHVVIDEFDGQIGITHLLRWCDKYPCQVETKGSGDYLEYKKLWITSNVHPVDWYPNARPAHVAALLRRIHIVEMNIPYNLPKPKTYIGNQNKEFWNNEPQTSGAVKIWDELLGQEYIDKCNEDLDKFRKSEEYEGSAQQQLDEMFTI